MFGFQRDDNGQVRTGTPRDFNYPLTMYFLLRRRFIEPADLSTTTELSQIEQPPHWYSKLVKATTLEKISWQWHRYRDARTKIRGRKDKFREEFCWLVPIFCWLQHSTALSLTPHLRTNPLCSRLTRVKWKFWGQLKLNCLPPFKLVLCPFSTLFIFKFNLFSCR